MNDIQMKGRLNGQPIVELLIDGKAPSVFYKATLIIESGERSQLTLEGYEVDEEGNRLSTERLDGINRRTFVFSGGEFEISGAANSTTAEEINDG